MTSGGVGGELIITSNVRTFVSYILPLFNFAQEELARGAFNLFYKGIPPDPLLAFTDGSILGVGNGRYGVVLHKRSSLMIISKSVGRMTDNVNCELRGIIEALKLN